MQDHLKEKVDIIDVKAYLYGKEFRNNLSESRKEKNNNGNNETYSKECNMKAISVRQLSW